MIIFRFLSHLPFVKGTCNLATLVAPIAFGIAGARIASQIAAGIQIANISHRSILKTPRFFASQANIARFSQAFFLSFSCDCSSSECVFASLANKKNRIASDLGMCDSNRIALRGCIARFGPLSWQHSLTINSSSNYSCNCNRSLANRGTCKN